MTSVFEKSRKIWSHRPMIVGTVVGTVSFAKQLSRARAAKVDLLELRLDTFPTLPTQIPMAISFAQALIRKIKKTRLPVLLTIRSHTESGTAVPVSRRRTDAWRGAVIEGLLPLCKAVDVEIRCSALARRIIPKARQAGVCVILSYHDFKKIPASALLMSLGKKARSLKGDILKIAGKPSTEEELQRLLLVGAEFKQSKLILIGMGKIGLPSRLLGYSFGSLLTYGHLGGRTAPGQIPVNKLSRTIYSIYGR